MSARAQTALPSFTRASSRAMEPTPLPAPRSRTTPTSSNSTLSSTATKSKDLRTTCPAADLDLTLEPREDHVSYIASWLKVLKSDNRAIFTAAAHAQRAADFLHSLQCVAAA